MPEANTDNGSGDRGPSAARRHVYIVDDDGEIRKSLHFLLKSFDIDAWPFASGRDFIDQIPSLAPAPILIDVRMPEIDGFQMLEVLAQRSVKWPVIVMTAHGDVTVAVRAMKLGAIDFLEKPFSSDLLNEVLNEAFSVLDSRRAIERARDHARLQFQRLSAREMETIMVLTEGVPNKIAALRLDISPRTVEMHRSNALAKLGLKSIAEVIALIVTADFDPRSPKAPTPRP